MPLCERDVLLTTCKHLLPVQLIQALNQFEDESRTLSIATYGELGELLKRVETSTRFAQNRCTPTARLTPDVLQYIFRLASEDDAKRPETQAADGDIWSARRPLPSRAIPFTQVCRYWRAAALADSTLWSLVHDRRDRVAFEVSRQSRHSALKLRLVVSPSQPVRDLMRTDGARIKSLEWCKANVLPRELQFLASPVCQLEQLVLSMDAGVPSISGKDISAHLQHQAQYIQQLTLRMCKHLPDNRFSKLTGLHLDGYTDTDVLQSVLRFLSRTPNVEDLVLSHTVNAAATHYGIEERVSLPHLRRLVFAYMSQGDAASFLSHLALPPHTCIRINGITDTLSGPSLFSELAQTAILQDATDVCVSSDVVISGPSSAFCFVRPTLGAWDQHSILRGVLKTSHTIRTLWLLNGEICDPRLSSGLPTLPPAISTVVVYDIGIAAVLDTLSRRAGSATARAGQTHSPAHARPVLHVLMTRFMSVGVVLTKLARYAELHRDDGGGVAAVVIRYLPSYAGDRDPPVGFDHAFWSLRFVTQDSEPEVALPEACRMSAHALWPAWG